MMFRVSVPHVFQFRMIRSLKDMIFEKGGDIHYIGGTEVLPPPLDVEEENKRILQSCIRSNKG